MWGSAVAEPLILACGVTENNIAKRAVAEFKLSNSVLAINYAPTCLART
jgi:hypothetical protein